MSQSILLTVAAVIEFVRSHRVNKDGAHVERQTFAFGVRDTNDKEHKISFTLVASAPISDPATHLLALGESRPVQISIPGKLAPTFAVGDHSVTLRMGGSYLKAGQLRKLLGLTPSATDASAQAVVKGEIAKTKPVTSKS